MNLTISDSNASPWKSVKAKYITSACGLVLAVSALAGVGTWRDGGSTATAALQPASARLTASAPSSVTPAMVFVIAGSELDASDHAASVTQDLNPAASISFSYAVVTNADEEAKARAIWDSAADELASVGTIAQFIDLRNR
jgi:hypothetical protein